MTSIREGRGGWRGLGWMLGFSVAAWGLVGVGSRVEGQAPASQAGAWSNLIAFPNVPVHAHVVPSGQVLYWGRREAGEDLDGFNPMTQKVAGIVPHFWDPGSGQHDNPVAPARPGYDIFCSGHAFLPDGRLLVAGGHVTDADGLKKASIFDPVGNTWAPQPDMNAGRWYPSVLALASGEMLVASGSFKTFPIAGRQAGVNDLPMVLGSGGWRNLTGLAPLPVLNNGTTEKSWPLYPFLHVAPDGNVFMSGPLIKTRKFDPSGAGTFKGSWDRKIATQRDFGSSIMYDAGKVLIVGGGDPPTPTAEVIDLNDANPAWATVGSMSTARRQLNATLLADGQVLVTGGTSNGGFNDLTSPVFQAELWNPVTTLWTPMGSAQVARQYHSTSLLLPDARVFNAGGGEYQQAAAGDNRDNAQVFSPPYLFQGNQLAPRPVITRAPDLVKYSDVFTVETPTPGSIGRVTWVRLPSVTHAYDHNQRFNQLDFQVVGNVLKVTTPLDANHAPPGHYMLFLFANGVPSVARIIRIAPGP